MAISSKRRVRVVGTGHKRRVQCQFYYQYDPPNEEEIDLENVDLTNVNVYKGVKKETREEEVHQTGFDDIKDALEILIAQHRSMMERIAVQDDNIIELQKILTAMASNSAEIGEEVPLAMPLHKKTQKLGAGLQ
ncbi:hypothetical protein HAX54_003600 [Datura stramonium]|uniref:Uncharacterized protein n=1 Tax=Datura stramonium TaxID=4076 RepID=A0ABS8T7V4_DATST|nr:hypothetical protein [Datura stramonium]